MGGVALVVAFVPAPPSLARAALALTSLALAGLGLAGLLVRGERRSAPAVPDPGAEALRRELQETNERLASRAAALERILEVSNELKSHLTLDQVLGNIVRAVAKSFGPRAVLLSLHDRTEGLLERRAQVGLDDAWEELRAVKVPTSDIAPFLVEANRISKSYFVSHLDRSGPIARAGPGGFHRRGTLPWSRSPEDMLLVPLTSGDHLVGLLQVDPAGGAGPPRLEEVQALEIFGNQAVSAIQSARAWEVTRSTTVRDSLTNAYNHRHFQEALTREVKRHERSGLALALLLIDIDEFKGVNDRFGHPVGDAVLRGVVEEITACVREVDTVARYGGEEFGVILPETPPRSARIVAERIRSRVAARSVSGGTPGEPLRVTVSIGVACYPDDAWEKRALIERADQALYLAKRTGRDRVVGAGSAGQSPEKGRSDA